MTNLTPDLVLRAYAAGSFPMADARGSDEIAFYQPTQRGVFDLRQIHVPRRLGRLVAQRPYHLKVNVGFDQVIAACASARRSATPDQGPAATWINGEIERVFCALHDRGHAHALAAFDAAETMVGGLYGLQIGGMFFGESMFTRAPNASKICFLGLCALLKSADFDLIDAQMPNPHLAQFGLQTWPNQRFLDVLPAYVAQDKTMPLTFDWNMLDQFVQSTTQTS